MVEQCSRLTTKTKYKEKQKQLHLKTKEQSSDSEGTFRFICEQHTQRTYVLNWTRNNKKIWKLVKLCANWKAVKNGLICMEYWNDWKERASDIELYIQTNHLVCIRFNSLKSIHVIPAPLTGIRVSKSQIAAYAHIWCLCVRVILCTRFFSDAVALLSLSLILRFSLYIHCDFWLSEMWLTCKLPFMIYSCN